MRPRLPGTGYEPSLGFGLGRAASRRDRTSGARERDLGFALPAAPPEPNSGTGAEPLPGAALARLLLYGSRLRPCAQNWRTIHYRGNKTDGNCVLQVDCTGTNLGAC